jgi:putative hydrolase of HD superfamily
MNRDTQFLFEVGALRRMPRQWFRFFGTDLQNITEHTFRVAWTALVVAAREQAGDTGKIVKLALVHDVVESRSTDVDYLSRQYVDRHEDKAARDIFEGTALADEFMELWQEYETRETIEAKIVKDADILDQDLEVREQSSAGVPMERFWKEDRRKTVRKKLHTRSAAEMWDEIYASDPHDWHVKGQNRFHDGDWQEESSKQEKPSGDQES